MKKNVDKSYRLSSIMILGTLLRNTLFSFPWFLMNSEFWTFDSWVCLLIGLCSGRVEWKWNWNWKWMDSGIGNEHWKAGKNENSKTFEKLNQLFTLSLHLSFSFVHERFRTNERDFTYGIGFTFNYFMSKDNGPLSLTCMVMRIEDIKRHL